MYIDKCISIYNILIKILKVIISCSYYTPLLSKYSFIIKNSFSILKLSNWVGSGFRISSKEVM